MSRCDLRVERQWKASRPFLQHHHQSCWCCQFRVGRRCCRPSRQWLHRQEAHRCGPFLERVHPQFGPRVEIRWKSHHRLHQNHHRCESCCPIPIVRRHFHPSKSDRCCRELHRCVNRQPQSCRRCDWLVARDKEAHLPSRCIRHQIHLNHQNQSPVERFHPNTSRLQSH